MDQAIPRAATAVLAGATVAATGLIAVTAPADPAPVDLQVPAVELSAAVDFGEVFDAVESILSQGVAQVGTVFSELFIGDLADAAWSVPAGPLNLLLAAPEAAAIGTIDVLLGEDAFKYYDYGLVMPPMDLGQVFTDLQVHVEAIFTSISTGITELFGGDVVNGLPDLLWGLTAAPTFIPWDAILGPLAVLLAAF